MNIVSPSILSCDFLNIESEIKHFEGSKDVWMHLDIMDGHFVPNLTFGEPIIKQICNKFNIPMDAHLMVSNPEWHMNEMKDYGLHNITFHIEACDNSLELITKAKESYPSVGISIKPKTPVSDLTSDMLEKLDLILVMSVEPGFGGQGFIPESIDKIKELDRLRKDNGYSYQIQVDGGVKGDNSKVIREAGANNLVAGSYVFKQPANKYLNIVETLR